MIFKMREEGHRTEARGHKGTNIEDTTGRLAGGVGRLFYEWDGVQEVLVHRRGGEEATGFGVMAGGEF